MRRGNVVNLDFAVVNVVAHSVIAYVDVSGLAIFDCQRSRAPFDCR
jgi:hypothetical protein